MATAALRNRLKVGRLGQPIGAITGDPGTSPIAATRTTTWTAVRQYAVFARPVGAASRHPVADLLAPNDFIANVYARAAFDEERWPELMVVPIG